MIKVIAYTTQTCPHCVSAKKYLKDHGILFEDRDLNANPIAAQEYGKLNLKGVPAFVIGDEVIEGFDKDRIESLLDYFITPCPKCSAKMRVPKNKGNIKVTCPKCEEKFVINTNK